MPIRSRLMPLVAVSLLAGCAPVRSPEPAATPNTFLARGDLLRQTRDRVRADDPRLRPAMRQLLTDADTAMRLGPFSVMHKSRVPPSGDRHDYMSLAPYWWADPAKPNGLPWIRRDGEVNPESRRGADALRTDSMISAVETLGLAYYLTGRDAYADRAAQLVRVWFLDPATRMNPHLQYAQGIPGIVDGRGIGVIDTRDFTRLIDAMALLETSRAWTAADRAGMRQWMTQFLAWLRTSENGRDEQDEENNHGTWYDSQVVSIALFLGDTAYARSVVEASKALRIDPQIAANGSQPKEITRTRPLHYSAFNLEAFERLAEMGRHVGVDLWTYRAANGASLRGAIDYIAPYADPARRWPGDQVSVPGPDLLVVHLLRARTAYNDARYSELLRLVPADVAARNRAQLFYPQP